MKNTKFIAFKISNNKSEMKNLVHIYLICLLYTTVLVKCHQLKSNEQKFAKSHKHFSYANCGPNTLFNINSLTVKPDIIATPGEVTINGQMILKETIESPIKVI